MLAVLAVAGVAAVVALPVTLGVAPAGARSPAARPGVMFRPVLCAVPPYDAATPVPSRALSATSCSHTSLLTTANLAVAPSAGAASGFTSNDVIADTALAGLASTTPARDLPSRVVLLPQMTTRGRHAAPPDRYVLGPAQMTSAAIASARAHKSQTGAWVVDWSTTPAGAALWDRIASRAFHRLLAIDVGGTVVSAPIIEPTQSAFSSFGGRGELAGNFTRAEAMRIARAMNAMNAMNAGRG